MSGHPQVNADSLSPPIKHDPARPKSKSKSQSQTATPSIELPDQSTPSSRSPVSPGQAHVFRVPQSPRSAASESSRKQGKVAIPRLKRNIDAVGDGATQSGGRHRVTHACEPCRHRKTKCSGERPTCRHCEDFKISCYYADGKRDRVKKYVLPRSSEMPTDRRQAIRHHDREGVRL